MAVLSTVFLFLFAFLTSHLVVRVFPQASMVLKNDRAKRNVTIDGLRGFLAYAVFLHHGMITASYNNSGSWTAPASNVVNQYGQGAVSLFFMITAFLFVGQIIDKKGDIDFLNLYIRRFFRLYPLYILVVGCVMLVALYKTGFHLDAAGMSLPRGIVHWLFFLPANLNNYKLSGQIVAGVVWTLRYEVLFYLSLPLFCIPFTRRITTEGVVSFFLLGAVFLLNLKYQLFLYTRLMLFLGGALAAVVSRKDWLRGFLMSGYSAVFSAAALASCLIFFHDPYSAVPAILLSLFFAVIASGNSLFGLLKLRAIRWMGEISYSTYLSHGLLLFIFMENLLIARTLRGYFVESVFLTVLLVLLNTVSYLYVELPGIALGKKLSGMRLVTPGEPSIAASPPL